MFSSLFRLIKHPFYIFGDEGLAMLKINSGLNIPITGEPNQLEYETKKVKTVAVTGADYIGMKPTMQVEVGQKVKKGEVLFTCKKNDGLKKNMRLFM